MTKETKPFYELHVCPECGDHRLIRDQGSWRCYSCDHFFEESTVIMVTPLYPDKKLEIDPEHPS